MCEVRKFLDRIYICSISQQLLLYQHIWMFLCYWFPGQEYLLVFVSSWKEAQPHICMRSCNTSIFFSWKLFSEHPFYETALSYSSYPQIGWNEYQGHSVEILGHTLLWTGMYENNHVEWGSLTAGLSRLADQQEQHSIEMSTDNYNKGTYIIPTLPKECEKGQL